MVGGPRVSIEAFPLFGYDLKDYDAPLAGRLGDDAGLTSGLVNTTAQVGGSLGLGLLATVSTAHRQDLLTSGASLPAALTGGFHLAFGIGTGLVLAAIAIAATVLQREPAICEDHNERPADGAVERCAA
jgi:hypothetical protein